jgi:antitoxin VapB
MYRVMLFLREEGPAMRTPDQRPDEEDAHPVRTRLFQSGNSQAVRIPKDLAFDRLDLEVEIYRSGDAVIIRPVRKTLDDIGQILTSFTPDFMAEGRDQPEYQERNWSWGVHED